MEKLIFSKKYGPFYYEKSISFVFRFDHIKETGKVFKDIEIDISKFVLDLYRLDPLNENIYFNCLLKEIYRNGLENLYHRKAKIRIEVGENTHLINTEQYASFVPRYEIVL